jgi:glutaconate CoA-transferase subunit A
MNKLISLSEGVKKYVKDRSIIASGGFPLARQGAIFAKEILRQNRAGNIKVRDLFWVEPGIGFGSSLLIAEALVDSMICTFSSHERPGLSIIIRDTLEKGIPRKIKWEDESNLTLSSRLMAGALNLPFIPSNSGIWGDLSKPGLWDGVHSYPKNIIMEDPYGSKKKVALLQAIKPDVSVVHVPFADVRGNGMILGSLYYDFWLSRAGKEIILVADHIVDTEMCRRFPNLVSIPGVGVSAVIPWYMGAWPTNSPGVYGEDLNHVQYFLKNSRGDALRAYIEKYVHSWSDHAEYLKLIGSELPALEDDPTKVLSNPFKEWIYSADQVLELLVRAARS